MLESVGNLPEQCTLVTLDVTSLYTNIPNQEGCNAVLQCLNQERGDVQNPSNTYLVELLEKVLTRNNFDFNGKHYLQVGGTAMGTKVAPAYANTFMGWYEETHVYTYPKQLLLWKRFIDDIFMIWQYNDTELDVFIQFLNSRMNSIKFEAENSKEAVHFLDVTITLDVNGQISTTLYTKPTDSHNYINYGSCHQKSCRNGIPYGQFLRLRRICSTDEYFITESKIMAYHFHQANYPLKLIQESFERAFHQDRKQLLRPKPDIDIDSEVDNLYLITGFHPTFNEVNKIVTRNMDLLDRSSSTRPALHARLVRGFRRCKNLRDHLVRAKITPIPENQGNNPALISTSNKCGRPRCIYCDKLDRSGTISAADSDKTYITRTNISCRCTNLIYALHCQHCGKIYVGQTKRRLMDRLMEHFRNIRNRCPTHIIGRHYNSDTHSGLQDLRVYVLEFIRAHPDSKAAAAIRDTAERRWIYRLRSLAPLGLNLLD